MVRRNRRKNTEPITWGNLMKNCLKLIGRCLWRIVCLIKLLYPHNYFKSIFGNNFYARPWRDKLGSLFRSEESSQREILHWVQTQIPGMNVVNFTSSWIDGIALCALVENLFPGGCPRYDLLKSLHHVNNCRLALKLAQRHLNVPQDLITAEDIINSEINNEKLLQLISFIHTNFARQKQPLFGIRSNSCVAKGSGLVAGMVNTRCKINILVPFEEKMQLEIIICGSNGENHKELINSVHNRYQNKKNEGNSHAKLLWKIGASKILKNPAFVQDNENVKKIQFEYHSTAEGQIEVNYVPKNVGNYKVSIKWKGEHVKGSPFSVLVAETLEKINEERKGKFHKRITESGNMKNRINYPRISKQDSDSGDSTKSLSQKSIATAAAVLQRSSTLHRSLSRISGSPELTKQGTITRRRVLKRIVAKAGEEIVIHEAPSMQEELSSQEIVNGNTLYAPHRGGKYRRESYMDVLPKSFDFEGSYESDSSVYKEELKKEKLKGKDLSVKGMINEILSDVLEDVFCQLKYKEHLFILEGKKKDFFSKCHLNDIPVEMKLPVFFGRGKRFQSTGSLNIPRYDRQFQASPLTEVEDVPKDSISESVDEIEKRGNLYRERRRSRLSEPSLDSFTTSIDSENYSTFSYDSRYLTEDEEHPQKVIVTSSDSSDCSRKGITSNSSNDTNLDGCGLVTVHTQLKDAEKHSPKATVEEKRRSLMPLNNLDDIHKRNDLSSRKTTSEPSTPVVEFSEKSPFMRSFSANSKMVSCDESDDVFVGDTSSLKLLTSNSLQKSCVYFSQKPIDILSESIEVHPEEMCRDFEKEAEYSKRKKLLIKQAWGMKKLHMSKSMPSLTQMWETVDMDSGSAEDEKLIHPRMRKRATMGPSEILPVISPESSSISYYSPSVSSNESKTNSNSRSTSSSDSKTGSRRGSLARQHEVMSLQILSEETSEEKYDSQTESDHDNSNTDAIDSNAVESDQDKSNTDATDSDAIIGKEYISDTDDKNLVDVSTQVSYDEIKAETGWIRPDIYTLRRRRPIKIEEVRSLLESVESTCSHSQQHLSSEDNEGRIIQKDENKLQVPMEHRREPSLIYPRQSTIDTIDSGIADENLSRTSLSRRSNKYLSGHKVISRNRYRGNIKLDPKLIKQNSSDETNSHKHLRRYVNMWSDGKKATLCSRESSVPEVYGWKWKKFGSKCKASVISKRVKFSRKVFVYRRSSSRSKTSSQSSKDSFVDSNMTGDTDVMLTKTFQVGTKKMKRKISIHKLNDSTSSVSVSSPEVLSHTPKYTVVSDLRESYQQNMSNEGATKNVDVNDIHKSSAESLQSSLESDGFGLTSASRVDLLSELHSFRKLSDVSEVPSSIAEKKQTPKDKPLDKNNTEIATFDFVNQKEFPIKKENISSQINTVSSLNRYNSFTSSCEASSMSDNIEGDAINLAMPLGEDYISFTGLLESSHFQDETLIAEVNKILSESDKESGNSEEKSSIPDPDKCLALGPGLRFGQVGVKNNFQVHTRKAGNGCLGVSITGPRPHTVMETNVTYTGDDIYEVIYEVRHPGFYVITIKWSEFNIPESPFICKVTF